MADLNVASWNIYFSHKLVRKQGGSLIIDPAEAARAERIADIIVGLDPHVMGIVECMPPDKLAFFRDTFLPDGYAVKTNGDRASLNVGLIYWEPEIEVEDVELDTSDWQDQLGDDKQPKTYKFTRKPLVVKVRHIQSSKEFVFAVVHPKSKKQYKSGAAGKREAYVNRKRIVAEGRRIHHLLWKLAKEEGGPYKRFLLAGDVNDGPWFDEYESRILRSGVESHIGSIFVPDEVLHSFVDLSNERGIPTTPASWGAPQLDHMLFPHEFAHGSGGPKIVKNSGAVRSDLVDFDTGSGKAKDSDHKPVSVKVRV